MERPSASKFFKKMFLAPFTSRSITLSHWSHRNTFDPPSSHFNCPHSKHVLEVGTSFTIFRGKKSGDQGKLSCTTVSLSALPSSGSPATLGLVEGVRDLTIKLIGHFLLVPSRWAGVPVFNLLSLLFCGIGQGRLDPGVVVTIFRVLREFSVSPGQFFQYLFWAMWLLPSPMPGG